MPVELIEEIFYKGRKTTLLAMIGPTHSWLSWWRTSWRGSWASGEPPRKASWEERELDQNGPTTQPAAMVTAERGYIVKTLVKLGFFYGFLLLTVLQYCCHIAGLPKSDSKTASMILCRCFSYIYTNISSEMWTRFEHSLAGESGA